MWKCYYFEGEFPDDEDDVQDMEACVVSETSSCNNTYEIKVKNCGKYYVYKLSPTRANEAFCFSKLNEELHSA
jgi:hypothetical protein